MIRVRNLDKKGQSFSTDILIVVVIVLFGVLFFVIDQINNAESGVGLEEKYEIASVDANVIVTSLRSDNIIDTKNAINIEKLLVIEEQSLREQLGIRNKFCIVFEKDGNLVKIDPEGNVNGIGNEDIIVNGVPCK